MTVPGEISMAFDTHRPHPAVLHLVDGCGCPDCWETGRAQPQVWVRL
jgi:hypothetical protein